ncbi:hypothetical protein QRD43_20730 [Pelomonas sp. APW6]|uniref:Uncharacterized protein n=1 Tax=Roseateles subflavus TaxID=3053353 RepID=A0ABT7LNA8_9BURK|nr:hypothetical protein [Pelomonas sp. APW6]MDL5034340.1 hypothetical protein [Pelomonas sp. APW6]
MLSLLDCSNRLREELGEIAPAYITLKRWSAAGRLKEARDQLPGRRPLYDYAAVRNLVCRAHLPSPGLAATQASPSAQEAAAPVAGEKQHGNLEQLLIRLVESQEAQAAAVIELRESIAPFMRHAASMARAVEQLDAVRKMLMTSKDAEITSARQRLELAQKEIARLTDLANPVSQARMHALLVRVEDALRGIQEG